MNSNDSDAARPKATKAIASAADSLVGHLASRKSNARKFVEQIAERPSRELSDDDLAEAREVVRQDPSLQVRVAELAKAAETSNSLKVRAQLLRWAAETIEGARPSLDGWKAGLPDSSGSLIAQLAKLSGSQSDPKDKQTADALLQTGVTVLMGQYHWSAVTVLSELKTGFERKGAATAAPSVAKLLIKGSARQFQDYANIVLLLDEESSKARDQARKAEQLRQEHYDRYLAAKADADRLTAEVAAQKAEIEQLSSQNEAISRQLENISSGAAHGQTNFRARYRNFLDRQLSPKIAEAVEALDGPDPFLEIVDHRLKSLRSEIAKEVTWLNESSE